MNLLWPGFLLLLGLIPLIIGGYIWVLRRRRRFAVRYSNLALVLRDSGDYQGARELLEKALKVFLHSLGENHPYTTGVQSRLDSLDQLENNLSPD